MNLVALQFLGGVPCGIQLSFNCVWPPQLMRGIVKMRVQLVVGTFMQLILWPLGTRSGGWGFADERWGFVAGWRRYRHIVGLGVKKGVILEPNGGEV